MPRVRRGNTQPTVAVQRQVGPWKRVATTGKDPYDDSPETLFNAYNGYIPDPKGGSGFFYRPGFALSNDGAQLSDTVGLRGQGVISHVTPSGTAYNFIAFGGKLYRADAQFVLFTDVTPASGVTIDPGDTTKVYGCSMGEQLVISDGVNKPWIASDLGTTPITGTEIEFNAAMDDWAAFGPPRIYSGSMLFVLSQVNSTYARTDIAWSAPGDASVGYQQATYDNRWTLIQSSSDPLFATAPTETQVYYFREDAVGYIAGPIGPSWQSNSTPGDLAQNVGTVSPQSVIQFGSTIFFCDQLGRPWRLSGQELSPLYLQMRGIIDESPIGYPTVNANVASAAYEPYLNLYLAAPYSTNTFLQSPPTEMYAFDVRTTNYVGRWVVSDYAQIDVMGNFSDPSGRQVLVIVGSLLPQVDSEPADSGYVWMLGSNTGTGPTLTTEDVLVITTEDDLGLTTLGTTQNWLDGDNPPIRSVQTNKIEYGSDKVMNVDRATVLVGDQDPVTVSIITSAVAQSVQAIPTPNPSADGVNRATAGFDGVQGRGCSVIVAPTTAQEQASIQSVTIFGVLSNAGPEDN